MSESEPLLPSPGGGAVPPPPRRQRSSSMSTMTNAMRNLRRRKPTKALPYVLLLLLGALVGAGGMYVLGKRPHAHEKPPMVPPIYKLPPVSHPASARTPADEQPTGLPRNPPSLVGPGTASVASEDATCSRMGLEILQKHNGTAVDAAITTTLCIGLLNAFSSGIGGGGFALLSVPEGLGSERAWRDLVDLEYVSLTQPAYGADLKSKRPKAIAVDFRETAPAAATEDMYAKLGRDASQVGGLAVGVPGELRGLEAAHRLYGQVAWAELFAPVIRHARAGWQVSRELARRIRYFGAFMLDDPVWAAVYARNGMLLVEGDWVFRPTYADTLEQIAKHGAGAFYEGAIADDVVKTVRKHGGIMTHDDLTGYRARVYPAISSSFLGHEVYSADAPASGGVLLGMFNILEPYVAKWAESGKCWGAAEAHVTVEAMKHAFGARSEVCDPTFARNLTRLAEFRTKAWAAGRRALIDNSTHGAEHYGLVTETPAGSGTTHLSVVDRWGGAASVTSTVNLIWGSHLMTPGGIVLNDEQDDYSVPGSSDAFGLPPSPHNYPAPGKRPLSSTAPTIVFTNGTVSAVLGGSGGSRIFPSVAQVMLALECGLDISQAIERERLHDQILPNVTTLEVGPDGVDAKWLHSLQARGHKIGQFDINVGSSEVQAVVVRDGKVWGSSDSRKNGVAAAY